MMKSITKYNMASSLVAILLITMFGVYSLSHYNARETLEENEKLEACIKTFWQLLSNKGTDFMVVDGKLLAGTYTVNGNFELPDKVQEIFGGTATIFMGDERVSTNVLTAAGKRAVGTKLVGPAYDAIFKQGKPYRGETAILGIRYHTAYDPIRDRTGKIIGVLYVGAKTSVLLSSLSELQMHLTMMLAGIVAVFIIFMVLLGRSMRRAEEANESHIKFQQTLIDTIPIPIYYKDADCRYIGCNKAFEEYVGFCQEELIDKTPHELWPAELAERYRQQDRALLENPGLQVYEATVKYADGTLRDVIFNKATFNESNGSVGGLVGVVLDITERKAAEEAVLFQNILLSTQQEASLDGILVVDENAKILSFNSRFVEIMAIPAELLETKNDEPVLKYVTGRMIDPQAFLEKVRYLYEDRMICCRDEIGLCDGKTLDRYTVPLLGDNGRYYGRLWSFRDITERKAAEEVTRNAYQQLQDIVEFLPDATFVVDKDKRVIAWNQAIEKMTGLKKEDVIGKGDYVYSIPFYGERRPILIDYIDEDLEFIRRKYAYINVEGRTLFAETNIPSFRNDGPCHLWATATPLFDGQGNQVGGIESIRDITEYKRSEEEQSRLVAQLNQARMMRSFMVRLSHDLKTPLTPLHILLPMIMARVEDPELKKMLDLCFKNTIIIKELTDKTGTLVKLSSDIKPYELEHIQLASLLDESLAVCAGAFAGDGGSCKNGIDPAIVVQVVTSQIKELFTNLISNAVRYSHVNRDICINADISSETVTVSVIDKGIGLDQAHLQIIFDEFFKVDESRHDLEASGLGLSICKRIVQNHGGRIWAESAGLGYGTSIMFTLNQQFKCDGNTQKERAGNE
ncbi:MAG: PAS domain-containing protein [Steroidobacteraceae bacterium]|nr:PAS domain-containing protein [Deltaproteobacteria bacterium]